MAERSLSLVPSDQPARTLTGRAEQLSMVESALDAQQPPRTVRLLARGGYGLGKTAFLAAAADRAESRGFGVVHGSALAGGEIEALAEAARTAAEGRPVFVALDDLHEARPAALEMISEASHSASAGVVIAAAAHHSIDAHEDRLGGFTQLLLSPLADNDATKMARAAAGDTRRHITADAAEMVTREAAGNPAMIETLLRHARAAAPNSSRLSLAHVRRGLPAAREEILAKVLRPEHEALDPVARAVLHAVSRPGGSTVTRIALRTGRSPSKIRDRLGMLESWGLAERAGGRDWQTHHPLMRLWIQRGRPARLAAAEPINTPAGGRSRKDDILAALRDQNRPVADIARGLGVSRQYVSRLAKDHNLPRTRRPRT